MNRETYIGLDELRRRLLEPPPMSSPTVGEFSLLKRAVTEADMRALGVPPVEIYAAQEPAVAAHEHDRQPETEVKGADSMTEQLYVTSAVGRVFESRRAFQEKLAKLLPAFDQADRLAAEVVSAFESVTKLAEHLGQFSDAYAPVKAFQAEVEILARDFEPIKAVQSHLAEISGAFHDGLQDLAASMDPARQLHARLAQLAAAFQPVVELQQRFEQMADVFGTSPEVAGHTVNGAAKPAEQGI